MSRLDVVAAVAAAAEEVDGASPLDEAAWLWLRSGAAESAGVVEPTGFLLRQDDQVHLCVHPDHRGAGLGARLLGEVDGPALAWSHGNHPAAARLAGRFGFERVRDLWVMRRPLAELPPAPQTPVRGFRDEDLPELLRVNAAAFAEHPEQGALDEDGFAARAAEPWFDPAGLLLATEEDRVLGFHWTKLHDAGHGEVYVVGVDPAAQGRGLGRDLTLAGLHHLRAAGATEALLYVEAGNAPALATYTRLGFTHADADTHVMYARD